MLALLASITKLTYRYAGRDFRLTDVHGNVVKGDDRVNREDRMATRKHRRHKSKQKAEDSRVSSNTAVPLCLLLCLLCLFVANLLIGSP